MLYTAVGRQPLVGIAYWAEAREHMSPCSLHGSLQSASLRAVLRREPAERRRRTPRATLAPSLLPAHLCTAFGNRLRSAQWALTRRANRTQNNLSHLYDLLKVNVCLLTLAHSARTRRAYVRRRSAAERASERAARATLEARTNTNESRAL